MKNVYKANTMERPFVVCHMLVSLDGKISGAFFETPETVPAIKAYGELRSFYECRATLYGTTTMLGDYAEGKVESLPSVMAAPPKTDWVNPTGKAMGHFIVAVDPQGQLAYSGLFIEKKGRPAAHVIEALTEQAAPEYLSYLQSQGVSYLFAGEKRLNGTLLLEKLHRLFGINKLMLAGGGIVNGSFLAEDLVDELSLVVAPVVDGANGVGSFTQVDFLPSWAPSAFHLKEVQTVVPDVLWLRYTRTESSNQ